MKSYIERNMKEYINNCYLETTGIRNNIKDIIECLNNWELDIESKKEIIKGITGQIEDIRDIDLNFYDEMMSKNKVKPVWENYYYYYINSNEINDILLQNIELNIENIKKQNISDIKMIKEDEEKFINFRGKIVRNNKLDFSAYKQIIPLSHIILNIIEKDEIEDERLKLLIAHKMIKLNDKNLQVIYGQVPEMVDFYINNNIQYFIDNIINFSLNEDMLCNIIKSNIIKFRHKNKIMEIINVEYINIESIKYIIDNYSQNKISKISEELKEKILNSEINLDYKLIFFEKELNKNNSIELIDKYLRLLPNPYNYIGNYKGRSKAFSIPNTIFNENILKGLENSKFKFSKSIKKDKIIVYNKKYQI